jgi:hypothetical protein
MVPINQCGPFARGASEAWGTEWAERVGLGASELLFDDPDRSSDDSTECATRGASEWMPEGRTSWRADASSSNHAHARGDEDEPVAGQTFAFGASEAFLFHALEELASRSVKEAYSDRPGEPDLADNSTGTDMDDELCNRVVHDFHEPTEASGKLPIDGCRNDDSHL